MLVLGALANIARGRETRHAVQLIVFFLLVFCLLAVAPGCAVNIIEETPPTADQVITRHLEAQPQAATWRLDTHMDFNIRAATSQSAELTLSMDIRSAIDLSEKKMAMDSDLSIAALNKRTDTQAAVYIIRDKLYTGRGPAAAGQWTTRTLSESEGKSIWEAQAGMMSARQYTDALSKSATKVLKIQDLAGVRCYAVESSLDAKAISEAIREMMPAGQEPVQSMPFDIGDMLKDINITLWFNRDNYLLVRYEMNAGISTVQQGSQLDGQLTLTGNFYDYGAELAIELPKEAGE